MTIARLSSREKSTNDIENISRFRTGLKPRVEGILPQNFR